MTKPNLVQSFRKILKFKVSHRNMLHGDEETMKGSKTKMEKRRIRKRNEILKMKGDDVE